MDIFENKKGWLVHLEFYRRAVQQARNILGMTGWRRRRHRQESINVRSNAETSLQVLAQTKPLRWMTQ
jgi:hypothetical protein